MEGYCGFLYLDDDGMPLVALHWENRFSRMVSKYCVCRSDCHSCTDFLPTLAGDCPRALPGRK